jgi:hypothetical protein
VRHWGWSETCQSIIRGMFCQGNAGRHVCVAAAQARKLSGAGVFLLGIESFLLQVMYVEPQPWSCMQAYVCTGHVCYFAACKNHEVTTFRVLT